MPIPVMHGELPIHGFRVDDVAYITDASAISERSISQLDGLEVLVPEALEVAQAVNANRTYFTHLSHLMGTHSDVDQALPEGVRLAHDGLVLEKTASGEWEEQVSDWVRNVGWA